jgi:hypothetical protein
MHELLATLPVVVGLFLVATLVAARYAATERPYIWASFAAHQVSAVSMILITRDYYEGGDMLAYSMFGSQHAMRLRDDFFGYAPVLFDVFIQRRDAVPVIGALPGSTGSMQALSAFLMYLFNDSLYGVCAAIAGASFVAKLAVYNIAKRELVATSQSKLLVACLLIPSAVFWSSGLLKEPVATIGLGMALHGAYTLATTRRLRGIAWLVVGGLFIGTLKPYLLPPLGLGAGFWYLTKAVHGRKGFELLGRTRGLIVASAMALAVIGLTGSIAPYLAPESIADEAVHMQVVGARTEGGSKYSLGAEAGSYTGQLALIPAAVVTALLRPAVFEATNPLVFVNSLEMLAIALVIIAVLARRGLIGTLRLLLSRPALLFCAAFVLTLAIGVGLTTTNLGTLSRYRMPLMPFFGIMLAALFVPAERQAAKATQMPGAAVSRSHGRW